MIFYCLFRFNVQIKFRDAPDTDAILFLIQIQSSDTAQRCSRHGCYSIAYLNTWFRYSLEMLHTRMLFYFLFRFKAQIQLRDAPDTNAILLLIHIQSSYTAQRCSRHECYSIAYSNFKYKYSPDTLQTQFPLCHSFITYPQHTVTPYTDVSLLPIQNTDTLQTQQSFWYSFSFSLQIRFNNHFWMASTSPSPTTFHHPSKWHL